MCELGCQQVPNQEKVDEIHKAPPSFSAPYHRFLKGWVNIMVILFLIMLALIGLCINIPERVEWK